MTDRITMEQIAEIEAAFEKATKGEWYAFNEGQRPTIALMLKSTMREIIMWTGFDGSPFQADNAANVKFIALAHNLMPALIAEAKDARALRAELSNVTAERVVARRTIAEAVDVMRFAYATLRSLRSLAPESMMHILDGAANGARAFVAAHGEKDASNADDA